MRARLSTAAGALAVALAVTATSASAQVVTAKVPAGQSLTVQVTGFGGVPLTGVSAVSLNVTATAPDGAGYVTAYPCGTVPNASNLNYRLNETVPNAVISPVDMLGRVCLFTSASTHLIVDVNGWFPSASTFQPLTPARLSDTRSGIGGPVGKVAAGTFKTVRVAGAGGVPGNATAAVLNVTSTESNAGGYLTVYPCGAVPNTSSVNFTAGRTVANMAIAPIDVNGDVCIFTSATTHLIVDVAGSFPVSAQGFQELTPQRRTDTRVGTRLAAGTALTVSLGTGGIPASGLSAVSLNVTATDATQNGFLTVYPCGTLPNASNVNYVVGSDASTAVIAPVNASSQVCVYSSAATHVIVDVNGYFPASMTEFQPLTPARIADTR